MTNKTIVECFQCGKKKEFDDSKYGLPPGWKEMKIEGIIYTLCEGHGVGLHPSIDYKLDDSSIGPMLRKRIINKVNLA